VKRDSAAENIESTEDSVVRKRKQIDPQIAKMPQMKSVVLRMLEFSFCLRNLRHLRIAALSPRRAR
jgi:hypothetical protein